MRKKKYLSELIGEQFKSWGRKKIFISAPTGLGKTTFVVEKLLSFLSGRHQKTLILCNRRLLREQYWYSLVDKYETYAELEATVKIMTYQELAQSVRIQSNLDGLFSEYYAIVCDEVHYFYADSDFNGFGTYALLQIIIFAGIAKEILFLSATMGEVKPLIEQTLRNRIRFADMQGKGSYQEYGQIIDLDYSAYEDFDRFHCVCVPDIETLCGILAGESGKSLVFIDSKDGGFDLKDKMIKMAKIEASEIALLNAENIDSASHSKLVENLAISHKLLPKVLITTSVLDNGVSIHDPELKNIVIITESRLSFLQMLGRVRAEQVEYCNLYFVLRTADSFSWKKNALEQEYQRFKELEEANLDAKPDYYLSVLCDNQPLEMSNFYRKALLLVKHKYQFYDYPKAKVYGVHGNSGLYLNVFAKMKTGNMHMAESKCYKLATIDPLKVIYEQMSWLGKEPKELKVLESEYRKEREKEFVQFLLTVKNYTQEELQEFKKQLVKDWRKDFFSHITIKNAGMSTEKLENICKEVGLGLKVETDPESRKKRYSVEIDNQRKDGIKDAGIE